MHINHNLSALNTYNLLAYNQSNAVKALKRLSSGLRINQAADDAAGLAISEKMRGQIRGLGQAVRNAQDAISMIQTAEGGAASIHDMLQRARELSVQAANGTLTDQDRKQLQDELGQILTNIDTTANNTEFNTIKLLNQSSSGMSQFPGISQSALNQLTSKLPGWLNDGMLAINSQLGIAFPSGNRTMNVEYYYDGVANAAASMGTADGGDTLTLRVNTAKVFDNAGNLLAEGVLDTLLAHEMVHGFEFTEMDFSTDGADTANEMWFMEGLAMAIQGGSLFGVTDHNVSLVSPFDGDYRSAFEAVKVLHEVTDGGINAFIDRLEAGENLDQAFANTTQDIAGTELAGAAGFADFTTTAGFINWFNTYGATSLEELNNYLTTSADFTAGSGVITAGGSKGSSSNLTLDQTITNGTGVGTVNTHFTLNFTNAAGASGSDIMIQVGANTGQTIGLRSQDLRTSALGLTTANIGTQSGADTAIGAFSAATGLVSSARSYFGAIQNRLEHTIANLTNAEENLTASESRIRDLDMAKEMMNLQKSNILAQAAQAMLAQANQQPQGVLQLIR